MLASARYVLYGKFPTDPDWTFIFDYTIKVGLGASPKIEAKAGEPPDMEAVHKFSSGVASLLARREGR